MRQCRACGANVQEPDRFCNTCGARLTGAPAASGAGATSAGATSGDEAGETGEQAAAGGRSDEAADGADGADIPGDDAHGADTSSDDADRTHVAASLPPPAPPPPARPAGPVFDDDADPEVTSQLAAMATGTHGGATTTRLEPASRAPVPAGDDQATTTMPAAPPRPAAMGSAGSSATVRSATVPPGVTGQVPASYAPYRAAADDGYRYEDEGSRFRPRLVLVAAIIAAGVAIATAMADIITIEPTGGAPAFETGTWRLNDLGTNNTVAAAIAAGLMVLGGVLACFRARLGAGLAAGAGLALAGWGALMIGLAEYQLSIAGSLTGEAPPGLAVTLTRDIGYWLIIAAGGAGVLVFLTSLALVRRDTDAGLNPWIAALGAAATLVAAGGPLIPEGDGELEQNWSSAVGVDLPTLYFAGRLVQLGVLVLTGVIGFLAVRRYGLGLAIGGFSIVTWLALTSLLDLTENPIGPAVANPGAANFPFPVQASAEDIVPHAATIGGIAVALFCAVVAVTEVALTRRKA